MKPTTISADTSAMQTLVREASTTVTVEDHSIICGCGPCHEHTASIQGWGAGFDSQDGDPVKSIGQVLGSAVGADLQLGTAQFDYSINVVDKAGGTSKATLDAFVAVAEKAMATWATFLGGASGAKIEVQLNVGGTSAVASAGPGSLLYGEKIDVNGSGKFDKGDFVTVESGVLRELRTGSDPNGSAADIVINVNEKLISNGDFFFDPTLTKAVPAGQIDFYSVLLHEIAHGLGFLGLSGGNTPPTGYFRDDNGNQIQAQYGTLYDFWSQKDGSGNPVFAGPNAQAAYGDTIRLENTTGSSGSDFSHFLGGKSNDLKFTLMNPFVIRGDRVEIGNIELAVLRDLGYDVVLNAAGFGNHLDKIAKSALPIFNVADNYTVSGTTISVNVDISAVTPVGKAGTSIAYEVTGANGKTEIGRIYFTGTEKQETITIDGQKLFGTDLKNFDGSLEIRLFNPMHGKLSNGKQSQAFTANGEGGTTSQPKTEPTPEPAPEPTPTGGETITGKDGVRDTLIGTNGDDIIDGKSWNDTLIGGAGDDRLIGGLGDDVLNGDKADGSNIVGDKNTYVTGSKKDQIVNFEVGNDTLEIDTEYGSSTAAGRKALAAIDNALSSEAQLLEYLQLLDQDGSSASKWSWNGKALTIEFESEHTVTITNLIASKSFKDKLSALKNGGTGQPDPEPVPKPAPEAGPTKGKTIIGKDGVRDTLIGTEGDDIIDGKSWKDVLIGGEGNDRLIGGAGWDVLNGDNADGSNVVGDKNTYVVGSGKDRIVNFEVGNDTLEIDTAYGTSTAAGRKALAAIDNALSSEAQLLEYLQLLDQDGSSASN
ncbi:MAG: hypothetical protein V2I43_22325, partial [Parvularcula sp.]|nr:hypothetical protein [Parvularcula sp.]